MRNVIWLSFLFVAAVAAALFLGENRATVTLFWPPYRIDLSLNLLLALLLMLGALALVVWRTFSGLRNVGQSASLHKQLRAQQNLAQSQLACVEHLNAQQYAQALQTANAAIEKATQYHNALQQARKPDAAALACASASLAFANLLAQQASQALPESDNQTAGKPDNRLDNSATPQTLALALAHEADADSNANIYEGEDESAGVGGDNNSDGYSPISPRHSP